VRKSDWEKGCYGVYTIDLCKVSNLQQDNIMKNFQITFTLMNKSAVKYDFLIMIAYQQEMNISRATGEIVAV